MKCAELLDQAIKMTTNDIREITQIILNANMQILLHHNIYSMK